MNSLLRVGGAGLVCLLLLAGCKQKAAATAEAADYGSDRDAIVQAVKSGQLIPNATGAAVLPDQWRSSSMNGQVYVGKDSAGGLLIVFPLLQSSGRLQCLLYAENQMNTGNRTIQVGQWTLQLSGQSQGKWHQASIATPRR